MAKFARIVGEVVAEVAEFDRLPPFHPEIAVQWREAPEEVGEGWRVEGDTFSPPPPPAPVEARPTLAQRLAALEDALIAKGAISRDDLEVQ